MIGSVTGGMAGGITGEPEALANCPILQGFPGLPAGNAHPAGLLQNSSPIEGQTRRRLSRH
jgi:hypothetical protein